MDKADSALLEMILDIRKEIQISAPIAVVFESLIEQMGPGFDTPEGQTMDGKFEPWVGGRWYRDLGDKSGHLWGFVQVIKPPTLLEIYGQLFMSYPALNHLQYRLAVEGNGTKLTLRHRAMGDILPEHRQGVNKGWEHFITRVKARSQG
jgi:uncharacterized protein YndB with AHSA1/START domain